MAWAPKVRAEGQPWELNGNLFTDLQMIRNRTGAQTVNVHWHGDVLMIGSGNQVRTFSWAQLQQYRGDALFDVVLKEFVKEEPEQPAPRWAAGDHGPGGR